MKKKILDIVIVIGYLFSFISILYGVALPTEYQLPEINPTTLLVGGGATTVLSSAGMYFKNMFTKQGREHDNNLIQITSHIVELTDRVGKLVKELDIVKGYIDGVNVLDSRKQKRLDYLMTIMERNIDLNKAQLESRLTNPFTDKEVKEHIKGVLENDKKEKDNI